MIKRLSLRGWKAFDELDLELRDGVTFVVARNGVGKTSIVEAASWGLFGNLSSVDTRASRRAGHTEARVVIEVDLPNGQTLVVDRRVGADESAHHTLDGNPIADAAALKALAVALGATPAFLSRSAILPSSLMVDERSSSGYLRDHLAAVFGVAQLEHAAGQLDRLQDAAREEAASFRKTARSISSTVAGLRQDLEAAEQAEQSALQRRGAAEDLARETEERLAETTRVAETRQRATQAMTAFQEVAIRAAEALGGRFKQAATTPSVLLDSIAEFETSTSRQLDEYRRAIAELDGRIEGINLATRQLATAGAICPVCRRAMSKEVAARAEHAHSQDISALEDKRADAQTSLAGQEALLTDVRALRAAAPPLPPLVDDASANVDIEAARLAYEEARDELMSVVEDRGAARANRAQLSRQLAGAAQQEVDAAESLRAHQREAACDIAARSMRATAQAILQERIDPLVAEVRNRWKKVHADRGALTLLPDGRMVLTRGGHTIEFAQFSSGEKVIALLEARMLVLAASTRASFLWLDEPMEHLDAISRRAVASLLATGTAGRNIRQIVVTTYEEELARTFEASEDAHLIWVDARGVGNQ